MKTKSIVRIAASLLLLSNINHQLSTTFAQGALTPPGAPAPTMKSLAQIEPRTPISTAPFTTTQPGSYYLTTNLSVNGSAITIAANNVNLDLNGFTIFSTAATPTGSAIVLNGGLNGIAIFNGHIQGGVTNNGAGIYGGAGFANGIAANFAYAQNVRVSDVTVVGVLLSGILLSSGNSTLIENCQVRTAGGAGLFASMVKSSAALDCGGPAIEGDEVLDSRGEGTSAEGIYANVSVVNSYGIGAAGQRGISSGQVLNCYGQSSGSGEGIFANSAQNCYGICSGGGEGVYAVTAQNCYGSSTSGTGVLGAVTAENCYGHSLSGYGITADTAHNCQGTAVTGSGVSTQTAQNCVGTTSSGSYGINTIVAANCYGSASSSGIGIYASGSALNCYGFSNSGIGISTSVASFCVGSQSGGTAISALVGTGCYASAGTNNITHKYNMP